MQYFRISNYFLICNTSRDEIRGVWYLGSTGVCILYFLEALDHITTWKSKYKSDWLQVTDWSSATKRTFYTSVNQTTRVISELIFVLIEPGLKKYGKLNPLKLNKRLLIIPKHLYTPWIRCLQYGIFEIKTTSRERGHRKTRE